MRITYSSKNQGIALIIAITVIMIMTLIITELTYTTRTSSLISTNFKDDLRAEEMAKSAFNFAKIFLKLDIEIKSHIDQFIANTGSLGSIKFDGMDPSAIHIWDLIPIQFPPPLEAFAGIIGVKLEEETKKSREENEFYEVEISNESIKININAIFDETKGDTTRQDATATELMLYNMLNSEKFSELFTVSDADKREQIRYNIRDYIDMDSISQNPKTGSDENAVYYNFKPSYRVKNKKLDSFDELHMIAEVDDKYINALADYITVYGDNKINIKEVPEEIFIAMFSDSVTNKKEAAAKVLEIRGERNINENSFFAEAAKKVSESGAAYKAFLEPLVAKQKDYLTTVSTKFKVIARGHSHDTTKTITAVVDRGKSMTDPITLLYWRIE